MVAKHFTWTYRKCILTEFFYCTSSSHHPFVSHLEISPNSHLLLPHSLVPLLFIWPSLPSYLFPMQLNFPIFSSFLFSLHSYHPYTITFLLLHFLSPCSSLLVVQWVVVTHVVNPSHFYVRYVAEKREHEILSKKINSFSRRDNCHFTSKDTVETGVWRN